MKKNIIIILINIFVIISFFMIFMTPNIFGIDDTLGNTYIFEPNNTFFDNVLKVIDRAINWNMRIGEIAFFIIGCFPRIFTIIFVSIRMAIYCNLVYIFTYGKKSKEYLYTLKYPITIIISYLLTLSIYPGYSETFICTAGNYNHVFGLIMILLAALPFRLYLEDVDILKNKKINILFLIISFFAGLAMETNTPFLLLYELIILLIKIDKKNIKKYFLKNKIKIFGMLFTSIGLFILYLSCKFRIKFFKTIFWAVDQKIIQDIIKRYRYVFYLIAILLVLYLITNKLNIKKLIKDIRISLLLVLMSIFSILIIYITPAYYVIRMTIFFFFTLLTIISYLSNEIFKEKLGLIILIPAIFFSIYMTHDAINFYHDMNEFNKLRLKSIEQQYNDGYDLIQCPLYDNKYKTFFPERLTTFEFTYCDENYLKIVLNAEKLKSYGIYNYLVRPDR